MDFETIEDKITDTLKADISYLRTVETYAGQTEIDVEKLAVRFPAAFVIYRGSNFEWKDDRNHKETVEFRVLVAARGLRGDAATRKGSDAPGDIGAYRMVKDVLTALANKDFGLDIEKMKPLNTSLVLSKSGVSVYSVDFQTGFNNACE
jgi:phage gp37-like protein